MPFIKESIEGRGFDWVGAGEGGGLGCVGEVSGVVDERVGVWVSCDVADGKVSCVVGDVTVALGLHSRSIANIKTTATVAIRFMIASG
jgi:hypothetical protein